MSNNTIKCKYCGREIEISEALQHKIEEQALTEVFDSINVNFYPSYFKLRRNYSFRIITPT